MSINGVLEKILRPDFGKLRFAGGSAALALICVASGLTVSQGSAQATTALTSVSAQEVQIDLVAPTPVTTVLDAVRVSNLDLRELWLSGDVTAYFNAAGLSSNEISRTFKRQINESYAGQVPAFVTSVVVRGRNLTESSARASLHTAGIRVAGTTREKAGATSVGGGIRLTGAQKAAIISKRAASRTASSLQAPSQKPARAAAAAAAPIKTGWQFPYGTLTVGPTGTDEVMLNYWLQAKYSGYIFDYDVWNDFGYEADFKQYHPILGGTRPSCGLGNDDFFYAARGFRSEVKSFYTNVRSAARPYFDGNDALDPCKILDLSIGIGKPAELKNGQFGSTLSFDIYTWRGNEASSKITLGQQRISNDCNNIGKVEQSDCMGLNDNREGSKTYLNIGQANDLKVPCGTWRFPEYSFLAQKYFKDTGQPDHYSSCND